MIVLVNGFDVALGIDTKYSQFYGKSLELRDYAKNGNSLCEHILANIKEGYRTGGRVPVSRIIGVSNNQ